MLGALNVQVGIVLCNVAASEYKILMHHTHEALISNAVGGHLEFVFRVGSHQHRYDLPDGSLIYQHLILLSLVTAMI
jgi:hypothetical protein